MSAVDAGRELDAIVAEKVMGHEWWRSSETGRRAIFAHGEQPDWFLDRADGTEALAAFWDQCPHFSTDIAAAWLVVERMHADGWNFDVDKRAEADDPWCACFNRGPMGDAHTIECAVGESAPHAICKAAVECASPSPLAQTSRGDNA